MWNFKDGSNENNRIDNHTNQASQRHSQNTNVELTYSQTENLYLPWWTKDVFMKWYRDLPDNTLWNSYICAAVLFSIIWVAADFRNIYLDTLDAFYNISYAIHIFALGYRTLTEMENTDITLRVLLSYLIDLGSYSHYASRIHYYKLGCYYVRLQRALQYLWAFNDYNLNGSILGTTLKYCYIFVVLRITWAWIWLRVTLLKQDLEQVVKETSPGMWVRQGNITESNASEANKFFTALYIVNKMFIPIGIPMALDSDLERITCLFVIICGCLAVTGAAVATLSLVISIYMSHEVTFWARYRLIMKEMKDSHVPPGLRKKVEKFYRMYWLKQRAVSQTRLLPLYPPTLPTTIYTDIYFEATQKSRILKDLPHQFLSEVAKKMETIHYIPGDVIIERGSKKSAIIFITYGDVEMLTAEDDTTPILRFTRGTVLAPCGGAAAAALGRSHLTVRAASFCTAHVLRMPDLWRVVFKHSVSQNYAGPILNTFIDHIKSVKRHYDMKVPILSVYKSSILHFNRNLMALRELKDATGESSLGGTDAFLEIAGCYVMRNHLDSSVMDESDAICLRPTFPCILQPSSSLLLTWHSMVAGLILVICITHPYYLIYRRVVPMSFRFFDYVVTAIFVLDHLVHLSTGAHIEEGVPIKFTQTSSQQMRSKWFVLDVIGTLPIFEFIGDGHFAGMNKILRLPKMFRVLKTIEDKYVYHSNMLRFFSYTLLLLIACYLIAAMQQAFMCYQSGYCLVTNFTHSPFWEKKELDDETVADGITFGLYWAISMITFTTHMETWGKENLSNVMYTMMILEFCIVLRTFMEAVYSATIMVTTAMREAYDSRITTVKSFLIRNEVDPELRQRFITYLQLCWYTDKAYKITHKKNSSIFYDLPHHVYEDIVGRHRIKYLLSIPFMKMLKKEELKQLAANAHLFYTSPNEILLNTGDLVNDMYVIIKGLCEVICPNTRQTIGELSAKMYFGATPCLIRIPAYNTIRAVTHVQVLCISKRYLDPLFENPHLKEAIEYIKTRPLYVRMQNPQPSFLKYEPLPPIPNREYFPLPRKYEFDRVYLHPFMRLGFLSILRYVFPRYTIRPDGNYLMRYECFRVSCALISAMVFPSYTYLVLQWPWLYYVTWFLDLSAVFDIFQRMLVAYYNKEGILVYHPSSTAAHYLRGAFITDLIGSLALENLESSHMELYENRYRVTPMKQFLMMNRLLQLYRFPSIMQPLQNFIERRDIQMMIYAIPIFTSMFNILTCMMIFNSVKIYYITNKDGPTTWLLEPFEDKGGSWIDIFHNTFRFNITSSPLNLHLAVQFWVVYETSTTGYSKFKPSNSDLMEVLFIGMAMSAMIITYFSVRIISIRANVNQALAGFQQHMCDINTYMNREAITQDLQNELRRYYEYNWEKMGGIDYRGVLKLCDQMTLRTDAILHIYGPTFAKCPLLAQADVSLLRMIGRCVRSVYFLRDMKIVECDDVVKHVYFVDYGGAESRVPVGDTTQAVRLPKGSLFGNLGETPTQRVSVNIVATSRLHLLMINSKVFHSILNEFPVTKALMEESREADNPYYILGGASDHMVKVVRDPVCKPSSTTARDIIKYIYFQEGLVLMYLIVISLCCIFMDLYNAGYQDNRTWLILTLYILDMCFFLKILMQFSLPLFVTSRNLKALLLPTRRLYFKRKFKYDMVSCIPFELLSLRSEQHRWFWFSWLRLNRLFRIVTVYDCLRRRNDFIKVNLTMATITTVTIWFSLFVHATNCLWYFIGRLEEQAQPKSSWIYNDEGVSWCYNDYICSLYFVITTFTQSGVGDIMPKKRSEVIFVTILMIISTMVFIMYVGEFSNIIQYHSFRSFRFYSKYLELQLILIPLLSILHKKTEATKLTQFTTLVKQEYLRNNRVSSNLVTVVNKYTLHLWRESRGLQIPRFLKKAPLSLRLRIMYAAYGYHLSRHHIFQKCEAAFLRQLAGCLRLYTYNEGMYVVKEKEITDCMYVIHTGKVQETCEEIDNLTFARIYPAGSYFGVGIVRNTPYTHSYQTMIKSQVLTLHLDDWEYLLAHFPESKAIVDNHMGNAGGKGMWPGAQSPEPPPNAEKVPKDSNSFCLLKLFDSKQMVEAGPSGFMNKKLSKTSTNYSTSSDESSSNIPQKAILKITDTSPPQNNNQLSISDKRQKEAEMVNADTNLELKELKLDEVPILSFKEKITGIAKKLMGRHSDVNLNLLDANIEDELLLEEEEKATQALLNQLDEARRLMRRQNNKLKVKNKRVIRGQETEKHLFTFDTDNSNTLQSLPRPLQISNVEYIRSNVMETAHELNVTHNIDMTSGSHTQAGTGRDAEITPLKTILKTAKTRVSMVTDSDSDLPIDLKTNRHIGITSSPNVNLDSSSLDISNKKEIDAENGKPEIKYGEIQNIPEVSMTHEAPYATNVFTEGVTDSKVLSEGHALANNQPQDYEFSNVVTSIISDTRSSLEKDSDDHLDLSTRAVASAVENKLSRDIQTVTLITKNGEPKVNITDLQDSSKILNNQLDADLQEIPNTQIMANDEQHCDVLSDSILVDQKIPKSLSDIQKHTQAITDAQKMPITYSLETLDNRVDADMQPIPDIEGIKLVSTTPITSNTELDTDMQSIPDTRTISSNLLNTEMKHDTDPIEISVSQLDADLQPIPDSQTPSNSNLKEAQVINDKHSEMNIQASSNAKDNKTTLLNTSVEDAIKKDSIPKQRKKVTDIEKDHNNPSSSKDCDEVERDH